MFRRSWTLASVRHLSKKNFQTSGWTIDTVTFILFLARVASALYVCSKIKTQFLVYFCFCQNAKNDHLNMSHVTSELFVSDSGDMWQFVDSKVAVEQS